MDLARKPAGIHMMGGNVSRTKGASSDTFLYTKQSSTETHQLQKWLVGAQMVYV